MDKQRMKKVFRFSTATLLGMSLTTAVFADDNTPILQQIQTNTATTLQDVNTLPAILSQLGQFIIAWMSPDSSDATATTQASFTQLGNLLIQDATTQASLQQQLNSSLLTGITKTNLPSANDLVYSSILGSPYYSPDPRGTGTVPQFNYIKNASGISLNHTLPGAGWRGPQIDQLKYMNFYNTVMAIESYNGYILSNQYADGNQLNALQTTLVTQASDPQTWFAKIASENIGWVMRQILMYQSESFVLLTQLVQMQKQMVTAQAMTNAAIIATGTNSENQILKNAQGS